MGGVELGFKKLTKLIVCVYVCVCVCVRCSRLYRTVKIQSTHVLSVKWPQMGHGRGRPLLGFGNPLHTCTHSWGLETHSTHVRGGGVGGGVGRVTLGFKKLTSSCACSAQ